MSVAVAVFPAAAINATIPPPLVAFQTTRGQFGSPTTTELSDVASVTFSSPPPPSRDRDPTRPASSRQRRRRRRRGANAPYASTEGRRDVRIYSWASRSYLTVANQSSQTVSVNKHGISDYGILRFFYVSVIILPQNTADIGYYLRRWTRLNIKLYDHLYFTNNGSINSIQPKNTNT